MLRGKPATGKEAETGKHQLQLEPVLALEAHFVGISWI